MELTKSTKTWKEPEVLRSINSYFYYVRSERKIDRPTPCAWYASRVGATILSGAIVFVDAAGGQKL